MMKDESQLPNLDQNLEDISSEAPLARLLRTVALIVSVHVVFFGGLLMQGCKRQADTEQDPQNAQLDSQLPPIEDDEYYTPEETNLFAPVPETPAETGQGFVVDPVRPTEVSPPEVLEGAAGPKTIPHTIQQGDSLYRIARQYNVTLDALRAANPNVDARRLRPGQTIEVPTGTSSVAVDTPATSGTGSIAGGGGADQGNVYVVQPKDTLWDISRRHNTTVDAIKQMNNLSSETIRPGQRLQLPTAANEN